MAEVERCWIIRPEQLPAFAVFDVDEAATYDRSGRHTEGPFVPAEQLAGAVEALREAHGLLSQGPESFGQAAYARIEDALKQLGAGHV